MSLRSRALVLLVLAAVVSAPLVTVHPFATHLFDGGRARVPEPVSNAAVLALFMLLGASLVPLARFVWSAQSSLGSSRLSRNLHRESLSASESGIDYQLMPLPCVMFATAGLLRPRIYASMGARESLTAEAFRAGLLHERAHQRRFDVAWRLVLAALGHAFRPIPAIRRTVDGLVLESEFAADRAALRAGAEARDLFEAMVAASQSSTHALDGRVSAALSNVGTLARLTALAEPGHPRPRANSSPLIWIAAGLAAIPLVTHLLFWIGAACF